AVGNTIIVAIEASTGGSPTFTCSDNKTSPANSYTTDKNQVGGTSQKPNVAVCHAFVQNSLSTSDTITVTVNNGPGSGTCAYNMHVLEFKNIRQTSPVDVVSNTTSSGNGTTATTNTIMPNDQDAVIGVVAWDQTSPVDSISGNSGTGWTNFVETIG